MTSPARIALIIFAVVASIYLFRQMLRSEVLVKDQDDPGILLRRRERPVAFWSFFAFSYLILIGMAAMAALLP